MNKTLKDASGDALVRINDRGCGFAAETVEKPRYKHECKTCQAKATTCTFLGQTKSSVDTRHTRRDSDGMENDHVDCDLYVCVAESTFSRVVVLISRYGDNPNEVTCAPYADYDYDAGLQTAAMLLHMRAMQSDNY